METWNPLWWIRKTSLQKTRIQCQAQPPTGQWVIKVTYRSCLGFLGLNFLKGFTIVPLVQEQHIEIMKGGSQHRKPRSTVIPSPTAFNEHLLWVWHQVKCYGKKDKWDEIFTHMGNTLWQVMLASMSLPVCTQTLGSLNSFIWIPKVSSVPCSPGCTSLYNSSIVGCKTDVSGNTTKSTESFFWFQTLIEERGRKTEEKRLAREARDQRGRDRYLLKGKKLVKYQSSQECKMTQQYLGGGATSVTGQSNSHWPSSLLMCLSMPPQTIAPDQFIL